MPSRLSAAIAGFLVAISLAGTASPQGAVTADLGAASPEDAALVSDLVAANLVLADQGVLDAFGHVSARDRTHPDRYYLARSGAPALVKSADIIAFDLDSRPLDAKGRAVPLERFIHGEIYKARPDVMAIVHTHAPALIPFGVTARPIRPIYHMGSFLSLGAPVFDIRAVAGDGTDLLIGAPELGAALARSLGGASVALMRGHGATVAGATLPQAVFRAVYAIQNAELQLKAQSLGPVTFLTDAEAAAATKVNDVALNKAWALWKARAMAPSEQEGAARR
jgi:HCOMODA/2-hydroxy-3-carboxy-muconic semialdehyde decarboxylase